MDNKGLARLKEIEELENLLYKAFNTNYKEQKGQAFVRAKREYLYALNSFYYTHKNDFKAIKLLFYQFCDNIEWFKIVIKEAYNPDKKKLPSIYHTSSDLLCLLKERFTYFYTNITINNLTNKEALQLIIDEPTIKKCLEWITR